MVKKETLERINELARKQREQGLTVAEQCEQFNLRQEYLAAFRTQFQSTLDNIKIKEDDGTVHPLNKKYPN